MVVELLARFDEEANINWAAQLEEVGAHVVYGVVGHKTHAKMALVVRREDGQLRALCASRHGQLSHPRTAKLYTDFGLFTCNEEICARRQRCLHAAHRPGQGQQAACICGNRRSPCTSELIAAIQHEDQHAKAGKQGT